MGRLEGRVAVVTGGAGGIGAATVQRFVQEGAAVVVADIRADAAEPVLSADAMKRVKEACWNLEKLDSISSLMDLLKAEG